MTLLEAFALARLNGVSPSGLHILLTVIDDAPTTPMRLAKETKTSSANITGVTDRLVKDGWLDRLPNPNDRRSFFLTPSERACDIFAAVLTP